MDNKFVKQVEKLILIAVIFILLFFPNAGKIETSSFYQDRWLLIQNTEQPLVSVFLDETNQPLQAATKMLEIPVDAQLHSAGPTCKRNFRISVKIANEGRVYSSNIRLDVPLLGNLDSPYQVLLKESFSHKPLAINELSQGSRTASFSIPYLAPGETETIVVDYFLHVTPLTANLSGLPETYRYGEQGYVDSMFLMPANKIESNHPEIVAKAREIASGLTGDLEKARAFFSFVISYLQYDLNSPNRNKGALSALRGRSGVCEDYASLFVALCRAEGIPARLVNGYADPRGRGDIWNVAPGETFSLKGYRHSWAEFYTPKTGWIPVDPTLNIYDRNLTYFASLPQASHLAQNYQDQNMRVRYQGGQVAVAWGEELTG